MSGSETRIEAQYFDGRSSRPSSVQLGLDPQSGAIEIHAEGQPPVRVPVHSFRLSPRLAGVVRRLELPDGQVLETRADDWVDQVFQQSGRLGARLERLERRWLWAASLGLVALLFGLGFAHIGWPWLVNRVVDRIPWSLEQALGSQTLALLGQLGMTDSVLPPARQQHFREIFAGLCKQLPTDAGCRLEFRKAAFANALALPGGTVVFTDSLLQLLEDDAEFIAIAGHELGHVQGRHGLHAVVEAATLSFLMSAAVGDVTLVALGGGTDALGAVLAANSREHEESADAFAFRVLQDNGQSPLAFARVMEKLEKQLPWERDEHSYFSSHPATAERISAAEAAAAVGLRHD